MNFVLICWVLYREGRDHWSVYCAPCPCGTHTSRRSEQNNNSGLYVGRTRGSVDAAPDVVTNISQGNHDRDGANSGVNADILAAINSAVNDVIGKRLNSMKWVPVHALARTCLSLPLLSSRNFFWKLLFFIISVLLLCAEWDWLCLPSLTGRFVTKFSRSEPEIESPEFLNRVVHLGAILVAVTLSCCYRPTVKSFDRLRRTPKTVNRMQPLNSIDALGKQISVLIHHSDKKRTCKLE